MLYEPKYRINHPSKHNKKELATPTMDLHDSFFLIATLRGKGAVRVKKTRCFMRIG